MVAVRESRHTFGLIEKADDFTVSVPTSDNKKEVLFCGTKSGKDFDKFKECDLKTLSSKNVGSPIVDIPGYHFECKIVYKTAMDPKFLDSAYDEKLYSDKDYHTLYFAEIKTCYKTE
jgi:flavin reductase (DIM6/NTAB) family NADH-FMN oxidoreductase RutF